MEFNWMEKRRLLSRMTAKRGINLMALYSSYLMSSLTGKAKVWGLPHSVAYEPTTSCNLRCPECPSGLRQFSRPTGNADIEKYRSFIDEVSSHVIYLTLYFQGEPFLHPSFYDMIAYAKQAKIYTATSSNAHYLTKENCVKLIESGLDKLIISLDGITDETYKKYRIGGQLGKVESGVRTLVETKKEMGRGPQIILQMIAFSHNEHEIPEVKRLKRKWGVDRVQIKTAQVYEVENNELLPDDPELSRYKKGEEGYQLPLDLPNKCWRLWSNPVLTQDGMILPCCFDKDGEHSLGQFENGTSFKETWQGADYQKFRQQVLFDRSQIDICRNCSEGVKVWN